MAKKSIKEKDLPPPPPDRTGRVTNVRPPEGEDKKGKEVSNADCSDYDGILEDIDDPNQVYRFVNKSGSIVVKGNCVKYKPPTGNKCAEVKEKKNC